jgi:hypothetical protein
MFEDKDRDILTYDNLYTNITTGGGGTSLTDNYYTPNFTSITTNAITELDLPEDVKNSRKLQLLRSYLKDLEDKLEEIKSELNKSLDTPLYTVILEGKKISLYKAIGIVNLKIKKYEND